jgi:peptide/nickel transport system substrate-binding protein
MGRSGDDAHLTTRRELLARAALLGLSGPALAAFLAAFGEAPPAVSAAPATSGTPRRGGTMLVTGHQEISSLSPDDAGPTVHWVIVTQIHNGVLEADENYVLQPVLAQSYETARDGLTYTFKLRQGVKFHNGMDFTAEDVKYTYEWYMNPANHALNANNLKGVDSVQAIDKYTVRVKMKEPNAAFLAKGATTLIVPAAYHGKMGEKGYKVAPVGTGAFKLKEWRPAEFTLVQAFDGHFRGRPYLDFFREDIVPEASVRAIGLRTGASDSAVWALLAEDNLKFGKDPNFTTFRTQTLAVNHFPINNKRPQFSDKRVRQAMMHAINRQRLIDDIFKGTAVLATSNLSPAVKAYYEPNVQQYPYDPTKAKTLLEEAGWKPGADGIREKSGTKLSFTCFTITGDQARRPEAEVAQQDLKAVGIDMKIQEAPVATITEKLHKGEMDASLFNWTYGGTYGDPDPSVTLRSDGGNNWSHFTNAKVDSLIDAGLRETDPAKRKPIYSEIQKIVAEEVPFLYMMYWDWFNIFTKRIKGLPKTALVGSQLYRKANEWWIG